MATTKILENFRKEEERIRSGMKREIDPDETDGGAAKRGCGLFCDSRRPETVPEEPAAKAETCWSATLAPAPVRPPAPAPPAPTQQQVDVELQALLPYLTAPEVRILALLEMPSGVLRGECARCGGRSVAEDDPSCASTPGCLCRVLADDHYMRDARACLARQLREVARQRRAAQVTNKRTNPAQTGTELFCLQTNKETADRDPAWDWLTQLQSCLPPMSQQSLAPLPGGSPDQQPFHGGMGGAAQMGARPQFMPPRAPPEQAQPPPAQTQTPMWGFSASTHALPSVQFQPAQQQFSNQQTFPQQGPYGQQMGFGQTQQSGFMQNACPLPTNQQPNQSTGFGMGFRNEGQQFGQQAGQAGGGGGGGGFGQQMGSAQAGGGGAFLGQDQCLTQGQFSGAQFTVQSGYPTQPQPPQQQGYGQPYAGHPFPQQCPQQQPQMMSYSPQCMYSSQCPPPQMMCTQQSWGQHYGSMPVGPPSYVAASLPAPQALGIGGAGGMQACPGYFGGQSICTGGVGGSGWGCTAPCCSHGAPPPAAPPPQLQQFSEVTAKAQVEGASALALLRKMTSTLPRTDDGSACLPPFGAPPPPPQPPALGSTTTAAPAAPPPGNAGADAAQQLGTAPLELSLKCYWRTPEGALAACERVITCARVAPRSASAPGSCCSPLPAPAASPAAAAAGNAADTLCLGVAVRDRRLVLWPAGQAPASCGHCDAAVAANIPPAFPTIPPIPTPPPPPPPPATPPSTPPAPAPAPRPSTAPAAPTPTHDTTSKPARAATQLPPPVTVAPGPWAAN